MSFTDETWYTIIKRGLVSATGYKSGDKTVLTPYPPSQYGHFSITNTSLFSFGTIDDYYQNSYNIVVFRPQSIVTQSDDPNCPLGVAYVKFEKSATTYTGSFNYYDSTDTLIRGDIIELQPGRPGCVEANNVWLLDISLPVNIAIYAESDAGGNNVSAGFCLKGPFTHDSQTKNPMGTNPGVDIFKSWNYWANTATSPSTMALFDEWCYGDYWTPGGTGGRPDPNPSGPDGGGGEYKWPNENIPVPGLPTHSAASAGFLRIYNISESELNDLASELWDPSFWNTIVKNFESPFDNIISLSLIPYNGFAGTLEPVQIGNYTATVSADKLGNTYYELDCGNVTLSEQWGYGNFLDMQTKMQLYLPFCSSIPIDPVEFMYGTINIKYHFDIFSGSCLAFVTAIRDGVTHVLYAVPGNLKTEIPINARNYVSVYASAISAGASMFGAVGSAAAGNIGGAVGGLASAAKELMTMKPDYQKAGNQGGTAGLMNIPYPYLIATVPKCYEPENYKALHGYMSLKEGKIGDFSGFLQVKNGFDELDTIACTEEEKNLIKAALSEGIYI